MDEILFRSAQKFENLQIRVELAAIKAKDVLVLYVQHGRLFLSDMWNSANFEHIRANALKLKEFQLSLAEKFDAKEIYQFVVNTFSRKWTKRDLYFGCSGIIIGCFIGFLIGVSMRKKEYAVRYMEAIQCKNYLGVESVTIVEDAIAPYECKDYDVLINVRAGSVQIVDTLICSGYGRTYRKILRKLDEGFWSDLPITLGRDCAGVIVDLGGKVKRLEIGDEVWLAVPFWAQGTLSQSFLINENRVSRKPKNVGFEASCSIPYAGSLALTALNNTGIGIDNAKRKEVLILGGCTPVGCILMQILTYWGAEITATCYKRAVPVAKALGAKTVLIQSDLNSLSNGDELLKELQLKNDTFDVLINTTFDDAILKKFIEFIKIDGSVISTIPAELATDSCRYLTRQLFYLYIWLRYKLQNVIGMPLCETDEAHLCHVNLDRLAEMVEEGCIQTVVDKVFQPRDIEMALDHIRSAQSIGSTIISFS